MITREHFVNVMQEIVNLYDTKREFEKAFKVAMDGSPIVTIGDTLVDKVFDLLRDELGMDQFDDLLTWWLWDSGYKVVYVGSKEVKVDTLDELYNYIRGNSSERNRV